MFRSISPESSDSDLFHGEQSSNEPRPPRANTPIVLNSTELLGNNTRDLITLSSISTLGPQIVTIDFHSNEPTMPYGFARQLPIIPPSLNSLNLPPNPFKILAPMMVANPPTERHDENYSRQLPEPWEPSPISTPPMNLSIIEGFETPHTTTDDNAFYSDGGPRINFFYPPVLPLAANSRTEKKTEPWNVLPKNRGSVAAHLRGLSTVAR